MGDQRQVTTNTKTNLSGANPPVRTIYHTTVIKSKPGPNTNQTTTRNTVSLQKMVAEKHKNVSNTHSESSTMRTSRTQIHTKGESTLTTRTEYEKYTKHTTSATKK